MEPALEMWFALPEQARMHMTIKLFKDKDIATIAMQIMKKVSNEARQAEVVDG